MAEVSSTNLRTGAGFDNLKASWGKKLSLGLSDFNTQLDVSYDYQENKEFLKDATLSGSLIDGKSTDDIGLLYAVKKTFGGNKVTEVKLTAELDHTTFTAELDTEELFSAGQLKEVNAQRTVSVGDKDVDVDVSYLVKAQNMRVKLMTNFGTDKVKVQFDNFNTNGANSAVELGYEHTLANGRQLSATLIPADKNLDLELSDSKFESGATWIAKASVPTDGVRSSLVDVAKVSLVRSWAW